LVVMALVLFALTAFVTLVPASETSNMEHYSLGSKDSQSGATGPVSEPGAAQMSERDSRRLWEAPALLRPQRRSDGGGGALLRSGCWLRLLLHP
jgi:hypothetical protein